MLSATAQPQLHCYLPHQFWDGILASNEKNENFKQIRIAWPFTQDFGNFIRF